jgi:hypothetical protein
VAVKGVVAMTVCAATACLTTTDASVVAPVPFVVSDEFTASGDYGDGQSADDILLFADDPACKQSARAPGVHAGPGLCYKFTYAPLPVGDGQPGQGFGGVAWQSPPNNWGNYPGKRVTQGAKSVHFAAASDPPGLVVTFGVGSSGTTSFPYQETFNPTVAQSFTLTSEMQEFTLPFGAFQKYDRVLNAFNWTISNQHNNYARLGVAPGGRIALYVDGIVWENH